MRRASTQNVLTTIATVVVAVSLGCAAVPDGKPLEDAGGAAAGYDVLLITLDTTRADRIGAYGYAAAVTPHLDGLADGGVRVVDAVTVAPITLPAHASILTGRYPPEHGVRDNGEFRLPPEADTLAERLAAAGYATGAFVSAFVLDARFGLGQGYALYDDAVTAISRAGALVDHANERDAIATTDAAIGWLNELDPDTPFHGWVHYFDPHQPYDAAADAGGPSDPYDAEIALVDREIGRLLAHLETLGRASRTLTVVVADHGEGLGEHDEETHTLLIYGSTMRVPWILHAPGALAAGQEYAGAVASVIDVVPTITALLALEAAETDGVSLTEPLDDDRLVYMESLVPWFDHGWAPLFGIRRHGDKMILAPQREYYDLAADPGETANLWSVATGTPAARRDRLAAELDGLLAGWPQAYDVAPTREIDPEEAARLAALGYAAGGGAGTDGARIDPKAMMPVIRRIDRAKGLAAAGRYDQALAEIEAITDEAGESRELLGQLARIYVRIGREAQAIEVLERYLEIRPSSQALVMLAQIRIAGGQSEAAVELLDRAETLDPRHGAVHIARGDLALARGDLAAARQSYLEAGRVDPYRATAAMRTRLAMLRARSARGS